MSFAAELQHYVATGWIERWGGTADARVPGGNCWHCGTAIAYCVQIQSTATGEQHEIGTTCAEKLGLDIDQIRERMADKRRAERWRARSQHHLDPVVSVEEPHGTVGRFLKGCYCLACIDVALTALPKEYAMATKPVLIDLASGQPAQATVVNTRYGQSWRVENENTWLTAYPRPKRRSTQASKGYVEAEVPCLIRSSWRTRHGEPAVYTETVLCPMASPLLDVWNVPIPRHVEPRAE